MEIIATIWCRIDRKLDGIAGMEEELLKKRTMTTAAAMLAAVWIAPPAVARAPCKDLLPEVVYPCEGSGFCGIWGEAEWDGILRHCLAVEGLTTPHIRLSQS